MARIRTIKPDFFKHEALYDAEAATGLPLRLAFAGMWCVADREGRFKWRPRTLKVDVFPFDEIDFGTVLDALAEYGFITPYEVDGERYGYIPSWHKHQSINQREAKSQIPEPDQCVDARTCTHMHARGEGKGKEGKGREGDAHAREEAAREMSFLDAAIAALGPAASPISTGFNMVAINQWKAQGCSENHILTWLKARGERMPKHSVSSFAYFKTGPVDALKKPPPSQQADPNKASLEHMAELKRRREEDRRFREMMAANGGAR